MISILVNVLAVQIFSMIQINKYNNIESIYFLLLSKMQFKFPSGAQNDLQMLMHLYPDEEWDIWPLSYYPNLDWKFYRTNQHIDWDYE
jgi:hypothetical protein